MRTAVEPVLDGHRVRQPTLYNSQPPLVNRICQFEIDQNWHFPIHYVHKGGKVPLHVCNVSEKQFLDASIY